MRRSSHFLTLVLAALAVLPCRAQSANASEEATLRDLNARYTRAFLECDVTFYRSLLTDDFQAVLADGRLIDRKEFLLEAGTPPKIHGFTVGDVGVRVYATSAVVTAWVSYKHDDDTLFRTRYSDLYVKVDGHWRLASVQWTRLAPPSAKP